MARSSRYLTTGPYGLFRKDYKSHPKEQKRCVLCKHTFIELHCLHFAGCTVQVHVSSLLVGPVVTKWKLRGDF